MFVDLKVLLGRLTSGQFLNTFSGKDLLLHARVCTFVYMFLLNFEFKSVIIFVGQKWSLLMFNCGDLMTDQHFVIHSLVKTFNCIFTEYYLTLWRAFDANPYLIKQWRVQDSPNVGAPTLRGRQHTILSKNCMKLKEFGSRRRPVSCAAP